MDVRIEFIDESDGATLADSEVPLASLPESFAGMETTITLGDAEYVVTRAEPATRSTIASLGGGRVFVRRVAAPQPGAPHFPHATVEATRPKLVAAPAGVEVTVRLPEDAWRQVEFVHASASDAVDAELVEVRRVTADHRVGNGFGECHARTGLADPLARARVTVDALAAALGVTARPFGLRDRAGVVEGGFAIPYSDAVVYGVARDGYVTVLGVHGFLEDIVGNLHPIALEQRLLLVDWRKAERLRAVDEGFAV
ncbi:MAG: hypothetical protein JWM10_4736 [Myxococcaceae bacterium]|nr:hypothetical protein [Myxococcaceae bacterium]